jgi:tetratricopeptide (TPR) repeat protein
MADPTLEEFERLLQQQNVTDDVNQAVDASGQFLGATPEQDVAEVGNGNIQLGTLEAPPEFTADQQKMLMANQDVIASQNNLPSGESARDKALQRDLEVLPGTTPDYLTAGAQSLARGVYSVLDIGPLAYNVSAWVGDKIDNITGDRSDPTYIDFPSDIIGEATGGGDRYKSEVSLGPLKGALAQTERDIREALGQEFEPTDPLTLLGSEVTSSDLALSESRLTPRQQADFTPYAFGLELAGGVAGGGALGFMGGVGSVSRQSAQMISRPATTKMAQEGRIIPRSLKDLDVAVGAPVRGEPSKIALSLASPQALKAELAYGGLGALSATGAGLVFDGSPIAMTAASIAVPGIWGARNFFKNRSANKAEMSRIFLEQDGQYAIAVDSILKHAENPTEAINKLKLALRLAEEKGTPMSTLGMMTGDRGIIAFENGMKRSGTGFGAEALRMDQDAIEAYKGMVQAIEANGVEASANAYLAAQRQMLTDELDGMERQIKEQVAHELDVAGTPLASTEDASKVLRDMYEAAAAKFSQTKSELYKNIPKDEKQINATEFVEGFEEEFNLVFRTDQAREDAQKALESQMRNLRATAEPPVDTAANEEFIQALADYEARLGEYKAAVLAAKEAKKVPTDYVLKNVMKGEKSVVMPSGETWRVRKFSQAELQDEGFGYTLNDAGFEVKTGPQWVIQSHTGSIVGTANDLSEVKMKLEYNGGDFEVDEIIDPGPKPVKPKAKDFKAPESTGPQMRSIEDFIDIRSSINHTLRNLENGAQPNGKQLLLAKILTDRLYKLLESSSGSEAYKLANSYTKKGMETFDNPVIKFDTSEEIGATFGSRSVVQGDDGAAKIDQLLKAEGYEPGIVGATEDYIFTSFVKSIAPDGVVHPTSARKFLDDKAYGPVLRRFPELRAKLERVAETGESAEVSMKALEQRRAENQKSAAGLWLDSVDTKRSIDSLIRGTVRSPIDAIDELVAQVSRDPSGQALPGLRRMFIDRAMEDGITTSFATRKRLMPVMRRLFDEDQVKLMEDVFTDVDRIVARSKIPPTIDNYQISLLMSTVGKVTGAKVGAQFGQSPLIMANVGGKLFESVIKKLDIDVVNNMTEELLLNPQRFAEYQGKIDEIQTVNEAVSMLQQWLLLTNAAGRQVNLTLSDQERAREQRQTYR